MRSDIAAKLRDVRDLPTLPAVARSVAQMVDTSSLSMERLSQELGKDQALTAKILRLVNSPFYGFSGKISGLSHAMTLLGVNLVKNAVLSVSVLDLFPRQVKGFRAELLWEHAVGSAVATQWLGALSGLARCDHLFVGGLLHDIGKVFLLKAVPADFLEAAQRASNQQEAFIDAERAVMGTDHAEVGALLAGQWRLPEPLAEAVAYHHKPLLAPGEGRLTALVHVADMLAYEMAPESSLGVPPRVEEAVWSALGLSRDLVEKGLPGLKATFDQAKVVFRDPEKLASAGL
jgi:HD-like signal output (HDOD) protein